MQQIYIASNDNLSKNKKINKATSKAAKQIIITSNNIYNKQELLILFSIEFKWIAGVAQKTPTPII